MLFTIGEILIDFIALEKGTALKDVVSFKKVPGGAPANVAVAVAKLGGSAAMMTQLGQDAFGDYLIEMLKENDVNTTYITQTTAANTGLAFVSVQENGARDFSFYRHPSADLLLDKSQIKNEWFKENDYLHFGSVGLVESPMKEAHRQAIEYVKEKDGIISFDPNVRLSLWDNQDHCRQAIAEFLPYADILKISDEELAFITGIKEESVALESLFMGDVKIILYTKGSKGATILTKSSSMSHEGYQIKVEDTTGAGDAFMGGFLSCLLGEKVIQDNLISFIEANGNELLAFANGTAALTTMKRGAIDALPTREEVKQLIEV
jgi:fructokinase